MGDGISVDLGALTGYAGDMEKLSNQQLDDNKGTTGDLRQAVSDAGNVMLSNGGSGTTEDGKPISFKESTSFIQIHGDLVGAAGKFLGDLFKGVTNLSMAAESCAITYASTDDLYKALFNQQAKNSNGIAIPISGQANVTPDNVGTLFNPADDPWSKNQPPPAQDPGKVDGSKIDQQFQNQIADQRKALANGAQPPATPPGHQAPPDSVSLPNPQDT